jgi:glycosyltransferase involved in cell wall biosynthesis
MYSFFKENILKKYNWTFTLCVIGALKELKIRIILLETIKIILESGVKIELNVIGDGPTKSMLLEYIRNIKLQDYIILVGAKDRGKILRIF